MPNQTLPAQIQRIAASREIKLKARNLRKNPTKWEKHLWYDFLSKYSVRFFRQKAIGYYIADFYCPKARLVIELDGAPHYTTAGQEYDRLRDQVMQNLGISILRFSDSMIDQHFDEVCTAIDQAVKSQIGDRND